jgi:phage shock protein PspC (stress-responsive transcriptional regulator)
VRAFRGACTEGDVAVNSDGGEPRRLRRSQEGRLITGVCAGLGRYTRIDPLVFRVGFALLVLTTGVGLVLYAGAFLLMAAPDGGPSKIEQLGRRLFDGDTVLALLGVALGAGMLLGVAGNWTSGDGLAVVVVFALALFVARSRDVDLVQVVRGLPEGVRGRPLVPPPPPGPTEGMVDLARFGETPPAPPRPAPDDAGQPRATLTPPGQPWGRPAGMVPGYVAGERGGATRPLFDDLPGAEAAVAGGRGRRRRYLAPLTLFAAALVAAVLFVRTDGRDGLDRMQIIVAGALAVTAAGLFLGAWFGRNRGLVTVGVIMSLALASISMADDPAIAARTHRVAWEPAAVAQAERSHRVFIGEGTVDLTGVPLAPGKRLRVTAQVTLGVLAVRVPDTARVEVDARALLGDITVDRKVTGGPGARVRRVLEPERRDGSVAPVIELRIRSKVGDMEITRVPA